MIFATVGSHPTFAFDRFLRALEDLESDDLVVQYGPGKPPVNASRAVAWMPFAEVLEHLDNAEKVLCHAGTGSVLAAMRAGHTPVIVPRLRRYEETVDDHQLDFARTLAESELVVLVEDVAELASAVANAPVRGVARDRNGGHLKLVEAVRKELLGP